MATAEAAMGSSSNLRSNTRRHFSGSGQAEGGGGEIEEIHAGLDKTTSLTGTIDNGSNISTSKLMLFIPIVGSESSNEADVVDSSNIKWNWCCSC
ncbi:unnamed protein product [Ambrosiozyma monospora]|uniref:Unnamed protein product n=1 Tax=Ambrosiozyma monospora TaxID=43982 RepID=A0ACB5SRY8_AMBMO|nr:unnamed protein product [Ambrosiozyma monospora]